MRLTRTTGHAIRILIDCAEAGGALVKVARIASHLDISQLNVFKIVHILSHEGFVEAMRGRHGGIRLARPAAEIRIGEIIRAIESTEIEVAGAAGPAADRVAKPQINMIFDDALEAFISVLDQHTIADMVQAGPGMVPKTAPKAGKSRGRNGKPTMPKARSKAPRALRSRPAADDHA